MILRKPYALLIKNFKLLHAIITVLMAYFLYKTFNLLTFLGDYISSTQGLINGEIVGNYFGTWVYLVPLFIIVVSAVLLATMVNKKKPYFLYITNTVIYIYAFVMILLCKDLITNLTITLVDIRVIKLIRDFTTLALLAQIYPLIKNFIRTVGFDIKKFDFGKDLEDLQITEKDNEEFEVNVQLDTNKVKRGVNSKTRFTKYIYKENKFLINIVIIIAILIVTGTIVFGIFGNGSKVSLNQTFNSGSFKINVTNIYNTNKDFKNNDLSYLKNNKTLIIAKMNINSNNDAGLQFKTANVELKIGRHIYYPSTVYRDQIFDLGKTYEGELLTKDKKVVLLVFEIPNNLINDKMILRFVNNVSFKGKNLIPVYTTLPVKFDKLDDKVETKDLNLKEESVLNSSILKDTKITINSFEIGSKIKLNYISNYNNVNYNSYEYIVPPLNANYDKTVLKIDGSIVYDSTIGVNSLNTLSNLISNFVSITYEFNGQMKTVNKLDRIFPSMVKSETVVYFGVPKEVENANSINFVITLRNKQYVYKIK